MLRHPDTEGGRQLRRRVCLKANAAVVLAQIWLSRLARREASMLRPCLHGHNRAKELGLSPIQLSLEQEITGCFVAMSYL